MVHSKKLQTLELNFEFVACWLYRSKILQVTLLSSLSLKKQTSRSVHPMLSQDRTVKRGQKRS